MLRKAIVTLTMVAVFAYLPGCYSSVLVEREQALANPKYKITQVVTNDGRVVKFTTVGDQRPIILNDELTGVTEYATEVSIPLSEIRTVHVSRLDPVKTAILAIGVGLAVGLVIQAATSEPEPVVQDTLPPIWSCPFVYSYDGSGYMLDGEPYGGSICEGLARTDLCELEHLLARNGEYRLIVTNELDETQYIDEFTLLVVDHPSNVRVIPDASGVLHTVSLPIPPAAAADQRGLDQLVWLAERDLLLWQSDVAHRDPERTADLRDSLFLTFPRSPDASSAKLVVNGCNTPWSSRMLKNVCELWGDGVDEWYEALKGPEWKGRLHAVYDREELTVLHVRVFENGQWVRRASIQGGGPYVSETRVVPLSLSDVTGDQLRILLTPPVTFWTLNSLAVDYSDDAGVVVTRLTASSAVADGGVDVAPLISAIDQDYYVAPDGGERVDLVFSEPAPVEGSDRTVFAQATGYYGIHLTASGPACTDELVRIEHEPGYVTRLALGEYLEWRERQFARARQ